MIAHDPAECLTTLAAGEKRKGDSEESDGKYERARGGDKTGAMVAGKNGPPSIDPRAITNKKLAPEQDPARRKKC